MFEKRSYERENFSEWEILLPELSGRRFVECSFAAADFSELGRCVRCTFDRCDFTMARWNGVEIKDSAFLGCNFKFANFFATVFDHCKMTGSSFAEAESELMTIDGGDWSYTELREIRFDRKQLRGIDFTGADLTGARFFKCRVENCTFREAVTDRLSFCQSDIRDSTFEEVDLLSLDLSGAVVDLGQCVALAEAAGAIYRG